MIARERDNALIACFLLCGIVEVILLPGVHALARVLATNNETADVCVFLVLMSFTACAVLYAAAGAKNAGMALNAKWWFPAALALLSILVASVATITTLRPWNVSLWFGYGPIIALIAVCALPAVILLLSIDNRLAHLSIATLTYAGLVAFYLPSILQPPWALIDAGHSAYVVNELVGPQTGGYPLVNFTAQYTSLLGYLFNVFFHSNGTGDDAVWFLTTLAVAVVAVALATLMRAFPGGKRYLAILFTVPAVFMVKAHEDLSSGSIAGLFSLLPVRLLFPAVIVLMLATSQARVATLGASVLLAFLCSLALWNNVESGVVTTIATLMVLVLALPAGHRVYRAARFSALFVAFLALDAIVIALAYGQPDLQTMMAFALGFGSGFGSWPMPTFGLWVFVFVFLSLGLVSAVLHFHVLNHGDGATHDHQAWRLGVIVLFWSAFGLGMSPYYINRSIVAGQLQFLLFPAFFAGAALLLIIRAHALFGNHRMILGIAALPAAVSLASIAQHPSLSLAIERLVGDSGSPSRYAESAGATIRQRMDGIEKEDGVAHIGIFFDFGFLIAEQLHVPSYLPVNHQDDLNVMGASIDRKTCALLSSDRNDWLISNAIPGERAMKMVERCGYERSEWGQDGLTVLRRR